MSAGVVFLDAKSGPIVVQSDCVLSCVWGAEGVGPQITHYFQTQFCSRFKRFLFLKFFVQYLEEWELNSIFCFGSLLLHSSWAETLLSSEPRLRSIIFDNNRAMIPIIVSKSLYFAHYSWFPMQSLLCFVLLNGKWNQSYISRLRLKSDFCLNFVQKDWINFHVFCTEKIAVFCPKIFSSS